MKLSKELNEIYSIKEALWNYTSKDSLSDEQKELRFKLFKWLKNMILILNRCLRCFG